MDNAEVIRWIGFGCIVIIVCFFAVQILGLIAMLISGIFAIIFSSPILAVVFFAFIILCLAVVTLGLTGNWE